MSELKIIVCGGRKYIKAWRVFEALELVRRIFDGKLVIIEGDAEGADDAASKWAQRAHDEGRNVDHLPFPANWKKNKLGAGPIRNQQMIDEGHPDMTIAFPGGRGTRDMCSKSRAADIPVLYGEELEKLHVFLVERILSGMYADSIS